MHLKCILINQQLTQWNLFPFWNRQYPCWAQLHATVIEFKCESNRYLTTATLLSATLRPRAQYHKLRRKQNWWPNSTASKSTLISPLSAVANVNKARFSCSPAARVCSLKAGTAPLQSPDSNLSSFCQADPEPGSQPLPWEELDLAPHFTRGNGLDWVLWKGISPCAPGRSGHALTRAVTRLLLPAVIYCQQQGQSQSERVSVQKVFWCATFICICEQVCLGTHAWEQCNTLPCHDLELPTVSW